MSLFKYSTRKSLIFKNYYNILRQYASSGIEESSRIVYEPEFSSDQQKFILEKLNTANGDELARFSLPKNRIKHLNDWRKKNGQFNTLIDVLDVEGLGVKTLEKLCKNILQGDSNETKEPKNKPIKIRGQLVTPLLHAYQSKELQSALGIHLYATGISWAKIEKETNYLSDWNLFEFDLGTKKLSPADALRMVINVSQELPTSDVYIFETPTSVTPTAQQSPISLTAYTQRIQLLSMLITLLSTSPKHNPAYLKLQESPDGMIAQMEPKVFFLRPRLPARLFSTLVGTERVSAATTVSNILQNNNTEKMVYSSLKVNEMLYPMYERQLPVKKEILGQSLLLAMTFMDVCVHQNPVSLKAITSNSK